METKPSTVSSEGTEVPIEDKPRPSLDGTPYLVSIKLKKLSGFDLPAHVGCKTSAFVQFSSDHLPASEANVFHGSEPFLCVDGPESALWKGGCTKMRMNDDAYFDILLKEGENAQFVVKVGFLFWADTGDQSKINDDIMYLVGKASFEVNGTEGSQEDLDLPVTPLNKMKLVSVKSDSKSKPKQIVKKAVYFPDFSLKLDVNVEDKSLPEPEIDDDAIEVDIAAESRGVQVTPKNSKEDVRDGDDASQTSVPFDSMPFDDDEKLQVRSIHVMSKVPSNVDKIINAEVSSVKKRNKSSKAPVVFERTNTVLDSITNGAALIAGDIGIISKKPEPYEERLCVDDETVKTTDTRLF